MNKYIKQFFLFAIVFVFLMSVSYAVDDSQTQVNIEEQSAQEEYVDEAIDSTRDILDLENTVTTIEDSSKTLKSEEESVPVEYVNITQRNYKNYFSVMGKQMFIGNGIINSNNSLVLNMQYFPNDINILSLDENSGKFLNRTLTITSDRNLALTNVEVYLASNFKTLTLENFNVTYTNEYMDNDYFTISDNVQHCVLRNVSIDMDKDGVASGYLVNILGNTLIENSFIRGRFVETFIDWETGPKTPDAYGIRVYARDCVLRNNTIEIISSGHIVGTHYSLFGIYLMNYNTTLTNNTIFMHNATGYAYGIMVRSSNNTISHNNISISSQTYSAGVDLEMVRFQNNMVNNNHVNVTASYGKAPWGNAGVAYGLEMLDFSYGGGAYSSSGEHPYNNSFVNNTIVGSAGQIYGIEIYGTSDTNLSGNTINITGRTPMGIGAIGSNITIADNHIINNGTHNHTEGTADYLEAINTGLYTLFTSEVIVMKNNTITSINGRGILIKSSNNANIVDNTINVVGHDYAVEVTNSSNLNGINNKIENNTLITTKHTGSRAVLAPKNNTVQNNIPVEITGYTLEIDITDFSLGLNQTVSSTLYYNDEVARNVNKGKVTFKVNGKTLKDSNSKVIYANVVNGTASIENYTITESWNIPNATIQALYSGSSDCDKISSEKVSINIFSNNPSIAGYDVRTTVGSTVTLTARVNAPLPVSGKVVFKINGKTVKDANGKVIYAKVINNTVSVEYALPESYKVGSYNLTAVFVASGYDKLVDSKTLIIA